MKRRHLFEFEDLPWFPSKLRNYVTEFLQTVAEKFNMFGPVVPIINELTEKHGGFSVVDLASGSGGHLFPNCDQRTIIFVSFSLTNFQIH